jgi:pimeloyl-ACP methyl ester carboxylesterase
VRTAAVLTAAAAASLVLAAPADAALRFKRCGQFGFSCARLSVPLDRSGAVPGRVSLLVKRLPARRRPRQAPLFALAGGPGQSATVTFNGDTVDPLVRGLRNRDLIVFDQRGTGRSGLLRCRAIEGTDLRDAGRAAGACARRLGARRAFYTSRDSADDIEAIRRELGVARIALLGGSYGTKVAITYALRYPGSVDRLVLDSVVEPAGPNALYLDTLGAVSRVLTALCRSGCRAFTRDAVADLASLVSRMATGPLRGSLVDSRGRRRPAALGRSELLALLLEGDVDPETRADFPGAVRAAIDRDPAPLLRLATRAFVGLPPPPLLQSLALYATTTCEETAFPWPRTTLPDPFERRRLAAAVAAGLPDAAFFPFDRATAVDNDLIDLCGRWPAAAAAPDPARGALPDVPVLLLAGEDDLRTPVENARRVAALFPHSSVVVAPATGHSVLGTDASGCATRAFVRFLRGRPVTTTCPRGRRLAPVTPPPPRSLRQVSPVAPGGVRGRTLAAIALTLLDVADAGEEHVSGGDGTDHARGGGLRAGRFRIDSRGTLRAHGLSFVPGVRLSGRLRLFGAIRQRGRIRVRGRAAARGLVTVRGSRVRGRLGGRRVRARLRPSVIGVLAFRP